MATISEKLAASLEELVKFQIGGKVAVIRAKDISRTHRERLIRNGFIQEVVKGWYIQIRPGEITGESTSWYTSFWSFCARYCDERFGQEWCLSPEQSLSIQGGNLSIPAQLLVRSPNANNNKISLPYDTSIFDLKASIPSENNIAIFEDLRLYSLPFALINCTPNYFITHQVDTLAALALIRDSSEILAPLLEGGHSTVAGRLAGAFRRGGRDDIANEIVKTMQTAEYNTREKDPFTEKTATMITIPHHPPYVNRVNLMWQHMRDKVLEQFPVSPGLPMNRKVYLKSIDDVYERDAYHSLSIEGYKVSPELIERVRRSEWNPDENRKDKEHQDALAARGYWQAFQKVKGSIEKVLDGDNPGRVVENDHRDWYRELFGPTVIAGVIQAADLAGYRHSPVFISQSRHVPPNHSVVRDAMLALFALLRTEPEPAIRAVLGHFTFVLIHPYMDGNGRLGRFLMNVMFASGGYPWTVVSVDQRGEYMESLEKASVDQDVIPFAIFLGKLVKEQLQSDRES